MQTGTIWADANPIVKFTVYNHIIVRRSRFVDLIKV